MRAVTVDQMRRMDQRAREEFGIPELVLMEHAGTAVARQAQRFLRKKSNRSRGLALVLAGSGANGGDGFVAARHLDNWRVPVEVVLAARPTKVQGAAKTNLEILRRLGVPIRVVDSSARWSRWIRRKRRIRLVVDALLGTGITGQVREPLLSMIGWLNGLKCPVVAVDIPSGLCADTGFACGGAVKATATVSCGFPKKGLFIGQGPHFRGRLTIADISLPRALL